MITVERTGYVLVVDGHANYAEPGQDIVCSAASILVYTLIDTLEQYKTNGIVKDYKAKSKNGRAIITCRPGGGDKAKITYGTIMNGFRLLAEYYPGNVRIVGSKSS